MPPGETAPRRATGSEVTLVELMGIEDANIAGTVHGGTVMKLVDTAGALAAIRHAGGLCVTTSIDQLSFHAPARVGDLVHIMASVNDVGRTSIEVGVRVEAENIVTGARVHTSSAYLVFVAVDGSGKPRPVPPLVTETETQARRQREAKMRRQARLQHLHEIESARAAHVPEAD